MASTSNGRGYYLVAADGGLFTFGNATFRGSTGGIHLNRPIVGKAVDPVTGGYWLVASDGGVFSFGDAPFRGSTGGMHLNAPIVGMMSPPATPAAPPPPPPRVGQLSVFGGVPGQTGLPTPGPATASLLNSDSGVAVDSAGNVYIADAGNNLVEKVTPSGACPSSLPGIPHDVGGPTLGPAPATFSSPIPEPGLSTRSAAVIPERA